MPQYTKPLVERQVSFEKIKIDLGKVYRFISELTIPDDWFSYRNGLKIGMFSPENSYSDAIQTILILRIYFKEGYKLYNRENSEHVNLWNSFSTAKKNPWDNFIGEIGYPNHPEF